MQNENTKEREGERKGRRRLEDSLTADATMQSVGDPGESVIDSGGGRWHD